MRSFNGGGVCTYGLNNQAGYNQNTLRQRSFGRSRGFMGAPLKRSRDQDSDSDEETHRYPWQHTGRRTVLDGIKRMRVSSPESPKSDVDSNMTDEEAATPRTTWRTNKAIVPAAPEAGKKRPLVFATPATAEATSLPWKTMRQEEYLTGPPIDIPSDASCRAMVVFDPYQSMNLTPAPRVDLVEDETDGVSSSESEEEHFVRFEELPEDNDEPVDMDID